MTISTTGTTGTEGVAQPLLRDVAFERIREGILDGTYPPGSFLSERELARTLEMSKTPVRVAFERLAEQGLVTISPQRGVVVKEMTAGEIAELYDLRTALETFTLRRLASTSLPATVREELDENLRAQDEAVSGEVDLDAFMAADIAFHLTFVHALGNAEIERIMNHQRDRSRRVIERIYRRDSRAPVSSVAEHRAIHEAVLAGDGEAAARAVERHLDHGKRFLLLGGIYGE